MQSHPTEHFIPGGKEFLRYTAVGALSFIVDFGTLILCREWLFTAGETALYWATACGFIAGLAVNTALSIRFVFQAPAVKAKRRGQTPRDLLVIGGVSVTGLALTEAGMYIGVNLCGAHYLIVKILVTGGVLFWNYWGRKKLVFRL